MSNSVDTRDARDFPELIGKTVVSAYYKLDNKGYDKLVIVFSDGKMLTVLEQGQVGWFSCEVS
jgi:hypothetical protein